jgi:hypothetical protein
MNELTKIAGQLADISKRLAAVEEDKDKKALQAEIACLEDEVAFDLPVVSMDDVAPMMDPMMDPMMASDDEEEKDEEKTASIVDPDGIEEQITQDYLKEVEDLAHGVELTTDDSMLDTAPTQYKKLRAASARLDAVAERLERKANANMALAARIDKVADILDIRAEKIFADGKQTMKDLKKRKDVEDPEALGGWLKNHRDEQ